MLLALGVLLAALAAPDAYRGDADPRPGAVARAAEEAAQAATQGLGPGVVALAVAPPGAEPLRSALETALAGALAARGQSVVALRPDEPAEAAARAASADVLLRVRPAVAGAALVLAAEIVPVRENFFLQRLGSRAAGSRLVTISVPADDVARALAGPPAARRLVLRALADLDVPVLALAAGVTGAPGAVRLVALTSRSVLLLDGRGAVLSTYAVPPPEPGPRIRDPIGAVAVGDLGAGRIGYALAGAATAEVLAADGDRLRRAGTLSGAPLAAGAAGVLLGRIDGARGALRDVTLARGAVPPPPPGSGAAALPATVLAAAAAPGTGRTAFALLDEAYLLRLLGPDLRPAHPDLAAVGAGFALADLDGDGEAEVIASEAAPGPTDRIRVVRPGSPAEVTFTSSPLPGTVLTAAAADLTGDGVEDAVLAATLPGGGTRLWLLTADGREERR